MRNDKNSEYDNISVDKKVAFFEEGHKYVHLDKPDLDFTSVTTIIKDYKEYFDAVKVASRVCNKKTSEYYGRDPEEVAEEWRAYGELRSNEGTELHAYGEHVFNTTSKDKPLPAISTYDGVVPDSPKAKHAEDAVKFLYDEGYELAITELLVYSEEVKVAGQSDILLKKRKYGTQDYDYMIYDWKFISKPLQKKSFYNRKTGYKMMKGPFKHLMDCNWIHYSIQLAIYQTLSGDPGKVSEKVMLIVMDDGYTLVPAYPMRVFWDQNNELQCVHEVWNGRWWDSRTESLYKKKPKGIVGL